MKEGVGWGGKGKREVKGRERKEERGIRSVPANTNLRLHL